jgi:S-adenosyl-L-methionine hydrolase (adenosine-forming)
MTADSTRFQASGVITLTSDFGLQDPFVGVMKGQIVARFPAATIIDLTHDVLAHWPVEAGFWLARSFRYFPPGTVHVAVVDPGVGGPRGIAVVEGSGHLFLAPDNGLLANVVEVLDAPVLRQLDEGFIASLGVTRPSATFHGRDIFAPVAAEIAAGRVIPERVGERVDELVPGWLEEPTVGAGQITGAVVTIDHFGNLITNIDGELLHALARAQVRVAGLEIPLRRTYSDVRPGDYLALINSFGVLEIARAEQSAAEGLGLARGAPVTVVHR